MQLKKISVFEASVPLLVLMALLTINVSVFDDSLSGANQIALIFAAAVGGLIAHRHNISWQEMEESIVRSISSSMAAILILLLIGALAGTWMLSGIVPTMIYYGLKILNPQIFLFAACVVCSVVSLATGSSWSTVATIGIALLGIGKALGISEGMVAGAIISGAYFGDKMSPLSDTTNLAPAMAGTDLFTHIRYMTLTTFPTMVITLVLFLGLGFFGNIGEQATNVDAILTALDSSFYISPVLFIVPAVVVAMILRKIPAVPVLLVAAILGGIVAVIAQPDVVNKVANTQSILTTADPSSLKYYIAYYGESYVGVLKSLFGSASVSTGNATVDKLLTTKGMAGMLNTIWLILCAMVFGGIMEAGGLLNRLTEAAVSRFATSTGSLISSTIGTCVFFNLTASDQYLAIVVPGKMYAQTFKDKGLAPQNLSRSLEDAGTVTSVLIPWNTCGATQASVLGVATVTYLPYCFFNIISPIMSILFAVLNIKIAKLKKEEQ